MRVADYIFRFLADRGIKRVYFVSGGGAMHLNDALGCEKRIQYVCNLHEQACAMAAEGDARISGLPGVVCVTTGPGGTNALTGVAGAWLDSIPMIVISGQIKRATCIASFPELHLRQLGDQELNIVDVVKPITKNAVLVMNQADIRYELEKAWTLCQTGRPGPVWIDVPLDIQAAEIEPETLRGYGEAPDVLEPSAEEFQTFCTELEKAERPVIVAGNGVRLGGGCEELLQLAEKRNIPVLTSISGTDLISSDHPLFFGRPGIMGGRAANIIMQNSDLLLVLGTRMGIRIIGYAYEKIARAAYKIMVDADAAELGKPTFRPDLAIHADCGAFLRRAVKNLPVSAGSETWLAYCRNLREKYPVVTDSHRNRTDYVSSYAFPEMLGKLCREDSILVTGNGTAYTSTFHTFPLKRGMRMFANEACASMGYGLPAAIGAALAGGGREVLCLTGDGSLQMNLQELQTVVNYRLPLKLFVYNNGGYLSIKNTQKAFFKGRFVGSEASSGIILPDLEKLADAYGLRFYRLKNHQDAHALLPEILAARGPVVIEVMTDPFEVLEPKAASKRLPDGSMVSAPLEDMAPFLPRGEFLSNMLIPPDSGNF